MNLNDVGFDFEEVSRLVNEDPDRFVRGREEPIQCSINRTSRKEYLAGLQMDIDDDRECWPPRLQSDEKGQHDAEIYVVHEKWRYDLIERKSLRMKPWTRFEWCNGLGQ